jgi:pimeloyl-ACP methyl ester carboxylesterase
MGSQKRPDGEAAASADDRPMSERDAAVDDEFDSLHEVARAQGLAPNRIPVVRRRVARVAEDQDVSALIWGTGPAEIVFLHGGGQNAHTWDSVLSILDVPAAAIDLPGHGESSWRADRDYGPEANARAVDTALPQLAPRARLFVGMSLGGLSLIRLLGGSPGIALRAALIDVLPHLPRAPSDLSTADLGSVALLRGPRHFASFEAMVSAAAATSPARPIDDVRRGVRNNARANDDGSWRWKYDSLDRVTGADSSPLWGDLKATRARIALMRGQHSRFVTAEQISQLEAVRPDATQFVIPGAGHSVQSDRPRELATAIAGAFSLPAPR